MFYLATDIRKFSNLLENLIAYKYNYYFFYILCLVFDMEKHTTAKIFYFGPLRHADYAVSLSITI